MCGTDNTTTYYSMQKKEFVFECEGCGYWEIIENGIPAN